MRRTCLAVDCAGCIPRTKGDLRDVPMDQLARLTMGRTHNVYKKGQVLFYEGNRPFGLYCIRAGKVKLYRNTAEGKTFLVRIAKEGELLGYRAFFSSENYSSTAEVLEDAQICFVDRPVFMSLMQEHPPLAINMLGKLGRDLRQAEDTATTMAYSSAQERIVQLMMMLKDAYGVRGSDGSIALGIPLTREDMANMMGTTLETTVRQLSWLKEKDIIDGGQKTLVIKNEKALAAMAPGF